MASVEAPEKIKVANKEVCKITQKRSKNEIQQLLKNNHRIIQFQNYSLSNLIEVIKKINFNESKRLFVILIESEKDEKDYKNLLKIINTKVANDRCFVIEIKNTKSKKCKYFYKTINNHEEFKECNLELTEENIAERNHFDSETFFNILNLLQKSLINVDLQKVIKIFKSEKIKTFKDLLTFATNSNDFLLIRMLQLFNYKLSDDECRKIIKNPIKNNNLECLKALLNLPFVHEFNEIKIDELRNDFGQNILLIAIDNENIKVLKFICNINFNYWKEAMNYAFNKELIRVFNEIKKIKISDRKRQKEKRRIVDEFNQKLKDISDFHESISSGKLAEVEAFIQKYPNLKLCYGNEKFCALEKAIRSRKFNIYAFLISKRFYTDKQDQLQEEIDKLNKTDKDKIRDESLEFTISDDDNFINILIQKFELSPTTTTKEDKFDEIRKMLKEMCKISEIKILLKTLSNFDAKIVMEYSSENTKKIDPNRPDYSMGVAYCRKRTIIVAENITESGKWGTLSHECTHQVLFFIYDNRCLPYVKGDDKREKEWNEILENCKKSQEKHDIVERVFTDYKPKPNDKNFGNIPKQVRKEQKELAVRTNHMLTSYKDEPVKLDDIEKRYPKLFWFYRERIQPDFQIPDGIQLRKLNKDIGLYDEIKNSEIKLRNEKTIKVLHKIDETKKLLIKTNLPILILREIQFEIFDKEKNKLNANTKNIFLDFKALKQIKLKEDFEELSNSQTVSRIIINADEDFDELENLELKNNIKYAIVTSNHENYKIDTNIFKNRMTINVEWNELSIDTQNDFLEKDIIFQSQKIKLSEIFSVESKNIKHEAIWEIHSSKSISLNAQKNLDDDPFYISRSFQKKIKHEYYEGNDLMKMKSKENERRQQFDEISKSNNLDKQEDLPKPKIKFEFEKIDLEKLFEATKNDKIILISDFAGTGKTSVLKHIDESLKETKKNNWITFVNLKEYFEVFEEMKDENFQSFLSEKILKFNSHLEKSAFDELYENKKAIFLFDGFDEISPRCKMQVIELIEKFMNNSSLQLWITTRTHLECDLEKEFDVLAYSITTFTEVEQIDFLVKFWSKNIKNIVIDKENEMKGFATKLINELSEMMKSKSSNLIGLPLQVQMLGDIYNDDIIKGRIENLQTKLNFFQIYDKFIKIKKQIWIQEKGKLSAEKNVSAEMSLNVIHQFFALKHFFNDLEDPFNIYHDKKEWSSEDISRCGIIRFGEGKKCFFIHETFAEFILADFIITNLKRFKKSWPYCKAFSEMFTKVLTEENFQIVRMFLNDGIGEVTNVDLIEIFKSRNDILHMCAKEGNFNLCLSFLKLISINDKELFKNILHAKDEKQKNLISNCVLGINDRNESKFKEIFDLVYKILSEELYELLKEKDEDGNSFLFYFCNASVSTELFKHIFITIQKITSNNNKLKEILFQQNKVKQTFFLFGLEKSEKFRENLEQIPFIIDFIKNNLTLEKCKEFCRIKDGKFKNLLHYSTEYLKETTQFPNFSSIFDFVEKTIQERDELIQMILECDKSNFNVFHYAVQLSTKEILELLWNKIKSLFNNDLQREKECLLSSGFYKRNALQQSFLNKVENSYFFVFELYRSYCETESEFKELILNSDDDLIHLIFKLGSVSNVKFLWQELKKLFNQQELKEILKSKGYYGRNLLNSTTFENESKEVFEFLWELLEDNFDSNELIQMINECDENNNNVFHNAVQISPKEILELLWNKIKSLFNNDLQREKEFLLLTGIYETNALQLSAWNHEENSFVFMFKLYRSYCETENEFEKLILKGDSDDDNLIHFTFMFGSISNVKFFWQKLKKLFNEQELKEILKSKSFKCRNLLNSTTFENESKEVFEFLWELLENNFDSNELIQMINERDEDNNNVFHIAAQFSTKEIIELLWNKIKSLFNNDLQREKEFLLLTGSNKRNALQQSALNKDENSFHFVFELYRSYCKTENEFEKLILKTDSKDNNLIHLTFIFGSISNVKFLLQELIKLFNQQELKEILKSKSFKGRNLLNSTTIDNKSVEVFEFLWELLEDNFDNNELIQMINERDEDNNNAFHIAAQFSTKEIIELLWNKIKSLFNNDLQREKEFLLLTGFNKRNALQQSAFNKDENSFVVLFKLYRSYCKTENEFEKLILKTDSKDNNLIHLTFIFGSISNVKFLWQELIKLFNQQELKEILKSKSFKERNLLNSIIIVNKSKVVFEFLWDFLEDNFDSNELIQMINECDQNHNNVFHNAALFSTREILELLWNKIKSLFNNDLQREKEFLLLTGFNKRNALQLSGWNKDENSFVVLFKLYRSYCKTESEFKELILKTDSKDNNLIHFTFQFGSISNVKFFWHELKKLFNEQELKEILKSKSFKERNLLSSIIVNKSKEVFEFLWDFLENNFDSNELIQMINECDENNNNVFHNAVQLSTKEILELLWNKIKSLFNDLQREKEFLLLTGYNERNALQQSALNKDENSYSFVFELYRSYCETESEFKELI